MQIVALASKLLLQQQQQQQQQQQLQQPQQGVGTGGIPRDNKYEYDSSMAPLLARPPQDPHLLLAHNSRALSTVQAQLQAERQIENQKIIANSLQQQQLLLEKQRLEQFIRDKNRDRGLGAGTGTGGVVRGRGGGGGGNGNLEPLEQQLRHDHLQLYQLDLNKRQLQSRQNSNTSSCSGSRGAARESSVLLSH